MIDIDKKAYKALKFISQGNKSFIDTTLISNHKEAHKNLPDEIMSKLHKLGFINISVDQKEPMLTEAGLKQLRIFENTSRKDWSLKISWIALIISGIALCFSIIN